MRAGTTRPALKKRAQEKAGRCDLVQIQEKLAEAQAQLDSEAAQRKILANETEKAAVEVDVRAERTAGSGSGFKPIGDALRESVSVLAESLASLITVVVATIPWLIVIVPALWFSAKAWRGVRRRRAEAAALKAPEGVGKGLE
jgi:hypothetical protein